MIHWLYTGETERRYPFLLPYLSSNFLEENHLKFLDHAFSSHPRSPIFYSRKLHVLFHALWSVEAFLHTVGIKDLYSFCHLPQIIGYWFQFIPKMIPANQFKMQIKSFSV